MSKKKFIQEAPTGNPSSLTTPTPISSYTPTKFQQSVKDYFKKRKDAKLERIENDGHKSELYDIDVCVSLDKEETKDQQHLQTRQSGRAAIYELKQDFYNELSKEYNITSMAVRGVRIEGNEAKTTISLILSHVPMKEHKQRITKLLENVFNEVVDKEKSK